MSGDDENAIALGNLTWNDLVFVQIGLGPNLCFQLFRHTRLLVTFMLVRRSARPSERIPALRQELDIVRFDDQHSDRRNAVERVRTTRQSCQHPVIDLPGSGPRTIFLMSAMPWRTISRPRIG